MDGPATEPDVVPETSWRRQHSPLVIAEITTNQTHDPRDRTWPPLTGETTL
ncbi:hypothetical protein [Dactylosporangium sp. NPDC000521]|uniref:hypothetical protein n=1 Tax=Dactylosporangium sp. NPDC000521 TaxID=3363975 RepID=UPI00368BEAFC